MADGNGGEPRRVRSADLAYNCRFEPCRSGFEAASTFVPADTAFVPRVLAGYDAVLTMYHDQGLPVIKHAGFDTAVNITLGLPILRTSVDHGTALDLAGTGRADPSSLAAAITLAVELATRSRPS